MGESQSRQSVSLAGSLSGPGLFSVPATLVQNVYERTDLTTQGSVLVRQ